MARKREAAVVALWLAATLAVGGCAYFTRQSAQDTENLLAAAGFTMRPADTPEKLAHLRTMPVRTIISRSKSDQLVFTYADPDYCKCLWVGNASQYNAYQRLVEQRQVAQIRLMAAQEEEMASMNWGMWGPWWW
jgi:hypothetical protein